MTAAVKTTPGFASRLVNGVLAIKPLANLAKHQARQMMIKRAERIGVPWTQEVETLQARDWKADLTQVQNPAAFLPRILLCAHSMPTKAEISVGKPLWS